MDYGFAAPIRIVPSLDSHHRCVLIALHGLFALAIAWHWPWSWGKLMVVAAVIASGFISLRELNFIPRHYCAVLLTSHNLWRLTTHDGEIHQGTLTRHPVLWSWVMLIPMRVETRATTVMLTRDMLSDDQWRRLTVRLKLLPARQSTASATE